MNRNHTEQVFDRAKAKIAIAECTICNDQGAVVHVQGGPHGIGSRGKCSHPLPAVDTSACSSRCRCTCSLCVIFGARCWRLACV